ncbi:MAG: hypothetical protein WC579_00130 [Candidatus Paceibacterota bacterium]|jgi:hypothetical protein|nr:hypothetical protein [Candidatus Paceibacterota bacterium]HPD55272.1 hypothetical protein [Candidatus Paceibacterota bacterium]HQM34911.1 hypothetical protein [Candidatus Paceibacterota bacterium]
MRFKIPQNSETVVWTKHSIEKMMQYQLSESRIKRVLHTPHRIEEGIAPQTIAVMQNAGTIKHPKEIWVMLQEIKTKQNKKDKKISAGLSHQKIRIISVWRYPGKTPIRELPKLPPEEWEFLQKGDF